MSSCLFQIYIVYNKRTGKPRGYAFIEYEHERDMHCEYQCTALSSNVSIYDHVFMMAALFDIQLNLLSFIVQYMDVFVMILGWHLSLTLGEGDHSLISKLMVMASNETEYLLQLYVLQFAW